MKSVKPNNDNQLTEILNNYDKVLFQFSADWCAPCKRITPQIKKYVNSIKNDSLCYCYIDIDVLEEFSQAREISSIPTFMVYDNNTGEYNDRITSSDWETVKQFCKKID